MMGWRIKTSGEERDATSARHYIKRMGRAGVASKIKRQMRRRARRHMKDELSFEDIRREVGPRQLLYVFCHPDDYMAVLFAVRFGTQNTRVGADPFIPAGRAYVMKVDQAGAYGVPGAAIRAACETLAEIGRVPDSINDPSIDVSSQKDSDLPPDELQLASGHQLHRRTR